MAAAVDLGSNSFHMIVAQVTDGQLKVIDRMREMVRLAGGLDDRNRLNERVIGHAMECLRRFGQRLRGVPRSGVRAVGTNTLRKARNATEFLARAEKALGHPIHVISGHEEARLIYLGVAHSLEDDSRQRLVVDIGGGSTELIIGRKFEPRHMESLHLGCVSHSQRYFHDGRITAEQMRAAEIAALQELESVATGYREIGWDTAIGASGTILAIHDAVLGEGLSKEGITGSALRKLSKLLIGIGQTNEISLHGVTAERAPVFPGGVAILAGIFEALGIEQMAVASGALREGLLCDLVGRMRHDDVRERTVLDLGRRHQIDETQAKRVKRWALSLYEMAKGEWSLENDEYRQLLAWAAWLHEIGLSIAHSQYHKHGSYLLNNLNMPGFSRGDQERMALLVRAHRRKFPQDEFQSIPDEEAHTLRRVCMLLRLAVLLHRSRTDIPVSQIELKAEDEALRLRFPEDWLATHPLTLADLEQEAEYQKAAGIRLRFK